VNKYVEKNPLDIAKARRDAAYNKMPLAQANLRLNKIKDLAQTKSVRVTKLRQ
jgi:hypothetical protein